MRVVGEVGADLVRISLLSCMSAFVCVYVYTGVSGVCEALIIFKRCNMSDNRF